MDSQIRLKRDCRGVNWNTVKDLYRVSDFDNGRNADELKRCFQNSYTVCFAMSDGKIIGTARAISDKISCATIFDVCVHPDFRLQGVGKGMMSALMQDIGFQHVLLCTTVPDFYARLGFKPETKAMSR